MGNYKFRISDMFPNAWFHKLKDMTKHKTKPSSSYQNTCSSNKKPSLDSLSHNSLVANIPQQNSPRNSLHTKRMSKRKTLYKPSLKNLKESKINGQDSSNDFLFPSLEISPESFVYSFYEEKDNEFVFEHSNFKINTKKNTKHINVKETNSIEKPCHASNIKNKPRKSHLSVKIKKAIEEEVEGDECKAEKRQYYKKVSSGRKSSAGINLKRVTSPRIHQLSSTRRSTSKSESSKQAVLESFAVMKRSFDPKKDFRESMVEMIEENKISDSKDLEDLLACYLSLNPKEYHDLIIHVFEQIWRQITKTK
ncbi:unnamed protein product [Cochlearia groenlandica]